MCMTINGSRARCITPPDVEQQQGSPAGWDRAPKYSLTPKDLQDMWRTMGIVNGKIITKTSGFGMVSRYEPIKSEKAKRETLRAMYSVASAENKLTSVKPLSRMQIHDMAAAVSLNEPKALTGRFQTAYISKTGSIYVVTSGAVHKTELVTALPKLQ